MAPGTDLSCRVTVLEGDFENVLIAGDESLDSSKQLTTGKPPCLLSAVRHSVISERLLSATDSVS